MLDWAHIIEKPFLVADSAGSKVAHGQTWFSEPLHHDPEFYPDAIGRLRRIPECVGFHLCGAFMYNRIRNRGLLNLREEEDQPAIAEMQKTNLEVEMWLEEEYKKW